MTDQEYATFRPTVPFENYDPNNDYPEMMDFIDRVEVGNAHALRDWLYPLVQPKSVIDIGCATGIYLKGFKALGCEVFGIDAVHPEDGGGRHIEAAEFQRVDLRFPYTAPKVYDMGICMEVAEHLPEHYAERLVDIICTSCNTVLFTGAVPGQGGTYHVNEKPHQWWFDLFKTRHNFVFHEKNTEWRTAIQQLETPPWSGWLKNNSFLLTRGGQ